MHKIYAQFCRLQLKRKFFLLNATLQVKKHRSCWYSSY